MRFMKLITLVGLILAVSGTAEALTFDQSYMGPLKFKFSDWDVGRAYLPGTDWSLVEGVPYTLTDAQLAAAKVTHSPIGAEFWTTDPPSLQAGEDSWGLFKLTTILGESIPGVYDVPLWNLGSPKDDVVGIFYGLSDLQVTLTVVDDKDTADPSDDVLQHDIWSAGSGGPGNDAIVFELYEVADGSATLGGPNARTAEDAYPLWATGNDADKWMSGEAVVETIWGGPAGTKYFGQVRIDMAGTVLSDLMTPGIARMVLDIDPTIGEGSYYSTDPNGEDLIFLCNVYGDVTGLGWTTDTDDPAYGSIIPEPVTMLGLFMGIGSLAGYIRKRRRA